jgi:hypothetical protein
MSAEPREYEVNYDASNELERQSQRAKEILERLAAHLAATEPQRDASEKDLVEPQHVQRAADLWFATAAQASAGATVPSHCVFISYSHADDAFLSELSRKLASAGVTHFKADRDIRPASDWALDIWQAIRACRVFVAVLTPRFIESRWYLLEGGAACASGKDVLTVLRYVDRQRVLPPFDRFQSMIVENDEQLAQLIDRLKQVCL